MSKRSEYWPKSVDNLSGEKVAPDPSVSSGARFILERNILLRTILEDGSMYRRDQIEPMTQEIQECQFEDIEAGDKVTFVTSRGLSVTTITGIAERKSGSDWLIRYEDNTISLIPGEYHGTIRYYRPNPS